MCGSRHKFPHRIFFAAVACRRQRLKAIHRKSFQGGGRPTASKGMGVRKQAQISPPPFFFAAVAWRRQRLEAIPPTTAKSTAAAGVQLVGFEGSSSSDGKIHRCRRRSAGRVRGQQQRRRQKIHRRRQKIHRRRQKIHRRRQKIHRRRRCSAGRAAAAASRQKVRCSGSPAKVRCSGSYFV